MKLVCSFKHLTDSMNLSPLAAVFFFHVAHFAADLAECLSNPGLKCHALVDKSDRRCYVKRDRRCYAMQFLTSYNLEQI